MSPKRWASTVDVAGGCQPGSAAPTRGCTAKRAGQTGFVRQRP